jgi:hypothetical protein
VQIYRHPSKIISRATEDYKILILFLKVSFFDTHDFTNSFFSKYGPKSREEISNFTGYPSNHFKGMRVCECRRREEFLQRWEQNLKKPNTLKSVLDVGQGISVGPGRFGKKK